MKQFCITIFILIAINSFSQTISCPPDTLYYACSLDNISLHSNFPYSETDVTITLDQLMDERGNATADCGIKEIRHSDTKDPNYTCPKKITRTFILTDSCDNVISCSQVILLDDMEPPSISKIPEDKYIEGCNVSALEAHTGLPYSDVTSEINLADTLLIGISASDNCGIKNFEYFDTQSGFCSIMIERIFYFIDSCGNVCSCVQTITINDITPPTIACPPDTFISVGGDVPTPFTTYSEFILGGGSANDNCGIDESSFRWVSDVSDENTFPETITRTYEVFDSCDNKALCSHLIIVEGDTQFNMECPSHMLFECYGEVPPPYSDYEEYVDASGSAYSACGLDTSTFAFVGQLTNGQCPTTITRTYSIQDSCGNIGACTQTITVNDTTPPAIACPADVTFQACTHDDLEWLTTLPFTITHTIISLAEFQASGGSASDNCAIEEINYIDIQDGYCPTTIIRTFTVIDSCGNTAACTQNINIDDYDPPFIDCPVDINLESITLENILTITTFPYSADISTITIAQLQEAGGNVSDNCSIKYISYCDNLIESCPLQMERYFTVNDGCDNTCTCSQMISSEDNTDPKLNCPPDVHIYAIDDIPERYYTIDEFLEAGGSLSDNCTIDSSSFALISEFMDTIPDPDILKRTYYIADNNMNDDICLHQIILDPVTGSGNTYKENFSCNIYPNPNAGVFTLNINGTKNNSVFVDIFSSAGKHIYSKELLMETNSIDYKINLSDQPAGVYHIKISEGANVVTKSIVIH